jgi:hypothetical protein
MSEDVLVVDQAVKRSASIAAIAGALAKAQAEIQGAAKDKVNPHFKSSYADLASVWDACRLPLSKNGLSVAQPASAFGPSVTVTTILMHSSGEWIEGSLTMTAVQNTPQGIGSCLTYARRYALSSMVGIAPEDDDGNAGSQTNGSSASRPEPQKAATAPAGYEKYVAELMVAADKGTSALMTAFNKGTLADRNHLTRTDNAAWEAMKTTAAKKREAVPA